MAPINFSRLTTKLYSSAITTPVYNDTWRYNRVRLYLQNYVIRLFWPICSVGYWCPCFFNRVTWKHGTVYSPFPRLEGIGLCGSRSIAPLIRNLRTRWRWVVKITSRPLYPGKEPPAHWLGGCVGPRAVLDGLEKRTIPCFCRDSESGYSWPYPSYCTDYANSVSRSNMEAVSSLCLAFHFNLMANSTDKLQLCTCRYVECKQQHCLH
jgi:hypothetical protein